MITIKAALQLSTTGITSDSAALDAQLLMCHVLLKPRSWLYAWPDFVLTQNQLHAFNELSNRRAAGEPIAYLTGKREFWGLDLQVTAAVLIPRPETELLVELALSLGKDKQGAVADLGTGSGAIALALAKERPDWQVTAIDMSAAALEIAAANVRASKLQNVLMQQGSWCEPLPDRRFSLIVSNPPYIADDDPHLALGDLRFEPRSALVAADNGLADIRIIVSTARAKLVPHGILLLEHGWQQGEAVRAILQAERYANIATHQDHGGRDRVTVGYLMG